MNENYQHGYDESLISLVQPRKIIEHFGGDVSEIRRWADLNTKEELLISIEAFKRNGIGEEYIDVLLESLNSK